MRKKGGKFTSHGGIKATENRNTKERNRATISEDAVGKIGGKRAVE